jgi:Tfp pilus assembly protein PilF
MRKSSADRRKKAQKAQGIGCVFCVLCLFCVPALSGQDRDPVQRFEHIASLIRDNRLTEAEKDLAAVLRVSPDLPLALNLMGTIRAKQGRLVEAESLFLRALRNDKTFNGARMNLAYLYLLKRAPEKSILQLKEVLTVEPDHAEAIEKLAELLLSQRRFDDCIGFIEKQKATRSVPAPLLVILGDAYLAKNSLQEAEKSYLEALEGRLDNAGALFGLAQISRLKGERREASIYLNRVATLAADSKSPEFLYTFAVEALRMGLSDEAKRALERALELKPKEPAYLLALGISWLRKGDLFEAEKLFRRLLEIQPSNAQGQLHLGYVLLNQKKYSEARVWLEKSARPGVAIPEVYYYLGLVAQEQNDDTRAIVLFERAVQKLPSYAHARIALGASYMKLKNYMRARQELETAVKLDPDEPTAHYNLALLYSRIKEPAKAQEEMRIIEKLKAKGASTGGVVVLPPGSSPR